mmetsp:Transcript_19975/g.36280  ORF Transcript_19975/g.36280 Transcript_19975/m.36280 type:complete len:228 (-) Transcript_19975:4434-5117(-)
MAHATLNLRFMPPEYPLLSLFLSNSFSPTSASILDAASFTSSLGTPLIDAYSSTCSTPVRFMKCASNCGQYPVLRRVCSGSRVTLKPASVASPLVGGNSAVKILIVVVFPAPLIPSRPKHWPGGIPRDILFTASFPFGYRFTRLFKTMRSSLAPPFNTRSASAMTSSSLETSVSSPPLKFVVALLQVRILLRFCTKAGFVAHLSILIATAIYATDWIMRKMTSISKT